MIKSCEYCKYGPNFMACQIGKTGKPIRSSDLSFDFGPSPTKNYLGNPKNMFCFEPRAGNNIEGHVQRPEDEFGTGYRGCMNCVHGPSLFTCNSTWKDSDARFEAYGLNSAQMPCFKPLNGGDQNINTVSKNSHPQFDANYSTLLYPQEKFAKSSGIKPIAILFFPLGIIIFALLGAIPGFVIGWITGFWKLHLIAAILLGLIILITYPQSRKNMGLKTDWYTHFNALCGAVGGGLACYFAGQLLH